MNIVTYNIFSIHNSNKLEQQIIDDQNLVVHILVKRCVMLTKTVNDCNNNH